MADITIRNLKKNYGDFQAVHDSTFTVNDGEFFMLLGPSGCGKTTTLRMIAGLELPSSGQILIDQEDVSFLPARARDIAFVFQMFALYPHMNVRKNITYPLVSQGLKRAQINKKLDEVVDILGIADILDQPIGGLSGGDRQRVALGRAIVRDPKAFMMDEPLGALDAEFREHMAHELRALHDRMQATTVYVTHDQLEAMQMGDKIVVMNHGVIEQYGTPQAIYNKPKTMFVAGFIGAPPMNFLTFSDNLDAGADKITLSGSSLLDQSFAIPKLHQGLSGKMVFGIRPEHVKLDDTSGYRGEILANEYYGAEQILTIKAIHGELKARVNAQQSVKVGETVGLNFNERAGVIFNHQDGQALPSD